MIGSTDKVQLKLRIRAPLRAALEAAARERGVSLNVEAVDRLSRSFGLASESVMNEVGPPWFIERMMHDEWSFGLLMVTGDVLCISHINQISEAINGAVWIDVELLQNDGKVFASGSPDWRFRYAPTERLTASVNVAHIVAAFELADT